MPATRSGSGAPSGDPEHELQDLASANAEIGRLRAMLAAKDTPSSGDGTVGPDRIADILEALSQRFRTDSPAPTKSAKIPDPPLLTDGKDPTFESWKLQMQGKL